MVLRDNKIKKKIMNFEEELDKLDNIQERKDFFKSLEDTVSRLMHEINFNTEYIKIIISEDVNENYFKTLNKTFFIQGEIVVSKDAPHNTMCVIRQKIK